MLRAQTRPHWVIAELDANGAIDEHAAMCLKNGIDGALAHGVELELLISARATHHAIADALDSAGLLDQLNFTWDPGMQPPARPRIVRA